MNLSQENKSIFFWQEKPWQELQQLKQRGLPHALLFAGIPGIGKAQFALHFAHALLCQMSSLEGYGCYTCHDCHLTTTKMHQNLRWIEPEESSHTIKIDQIREMSEFISLTALRGIHRVVIINLVDRMNTNAANALLKTLEEPSAGAIIILISHQPGRLPPTILSRCCRINFPRPSLAEASAWLKNKLTDPNIDAELLLRLTQGAPIAALSFVTEDVLSVRKNLYQALYLLNLQQADPIKLASQIQEHDLLRYLDFIAAWLIDLIRLQLGEELTAITNKDWANELNALKERTQLKTTIKLLEFIQQLSNQLNVGINLNKQLMLETVLIRYSRCMPS